MASVERLMMDNGIPKGRTVAAGLFAGLLVWLFAPVDLAPNLVAVRSAPIERVVPQGLTDPIALPVPDGFIRGLVGMREVDARAEAARLGFTARTVRVNFMPRFRTEDFRLGRLQFSVVLGRVVKVVEG